MANTVINPTVYSRKTQVHLMNALVMSPLCDHSFESNITPGYTIQKPYVNHGRVQSYSFSTDLTIDGRTWVSNSYNIDQVKSATGNWDPLQNMQSSVTDIEDMITSSNGYVLGNYIDQYAIQTAVNGAGSTLAGSTISVSNVYELLSHANAKLAAGQARAGRRCILLDPYLKSVLEEKMVASGFKAADDALYNGFTGMERAGLRVYETNNLPFSVTLTASTIFTAGDTLTIKGVTLTAAASGAATNPGDFSIGADAAAMQVNLRALINGTGTPGASTYIDLSKDNRSKFQNAQVACTAFSGNVATISGYGVLAVTMPTVRGSNAVGTETGSTVAFVEGAESLTIQKYPFTEQREPSANHSVNVLQTTMFGGGVFVREAPSIVKVTFNAINSY